MSFVYSVTTLFDSNKWHSSDETRETTTELYSTLKSANRAALEWAKSNKNHEDYDDDDDEGGSYSPNGCYSESWDASKYESYSVEVNVMRVFGPDLAKGEKDEDSEDEEDEEDEEAATSSEVEIVEPSAKAPRKRLRTGN